mmetsp:Transcript_1020/g.2663  ORF Transcript_1020/g.2663 Transcript_1020/m.2663 type:complete len:236 (-) Transcript_1020:438-1145(-)
MPATRRRVSAACHTARAQPAQTSAPNQRKPALAAHARARHGLSNEADRRVERWWAAERRGEGAHLLRQRRIQAVSDEGPLLGVGERVREAVRGEGHAARRHGHLRHGLRRERVDHLRRRRAAVLGVERRRATRHGAVRGIRRGGGLQGIVSHRLEPVPSVSDRVVGAPRQPLGNMEPAVAQLLDALRDDGILRACPSDALWLLLGLRLHLSDHDAVLARAVHGGAAVVLLDLAAL